VVESKYSLLEGSATSESNALREQVVRRGREEKGKGD
jgi:hypothetical protein